MCQCSVAALSRHRVADTADKVTAQVRLRARESGTASELELLRLALQAGRMGTWDWNLGTNVVSWSPSLERIHGLSPGSFSGTFEGIRRTFIPTIVSASSKRWQRVRSAARNSIANIGSSCRMEVSVGWRAGAPWFTPRKRT